MKVDFIKLEKYIFDCIVFSEYQKQPTTKAQKIAYLLEVCNNEKKYNKYPTEKDLFIDWCYGLPSCFNMDYQQYKVVKLMDQFGIKQPKNDYQLFDFWYGLLYNSVYYLNNKLNKKKQFKKLIKI